MFHVLIFTFGGIKISKLVVAINPLNCRFCRPFLVFYETMFVCCFNQAFRKIKKKLMTKINVYLTFAGNCREAMTFYKECLGGELTLQTIGESPMAGKLPPQMKECILHATLTKGAMVLMGSDMVDEKGLVKGNAVSLTLECSSEKEIRAFYGNLSAEGEATHPLEDTFWGALFGDLTDKFGNHWLFNFDKNPGK